MCRQASAAPCALRIAVERRLDAIGARRSGGRCGTVRVFDSASGVITTARLSDGVDARCNIRGTVIAATPTTTTTDVAKVRVSSGLPAGSAPVAAPGREWGRDSVLRADEQRRFEFACAPVSARGSLSGRPFDDADEALCKSGRASRNGLRRSDRMQSFDFVRESPSTGYLPVTRKYRSTPRL